MLEQQSGAVQCGPVWSGPVQSRVVQSCLVQFSLVPSGLVQSSEVQSGLVQSCPVLSGPVRFAQFSLQDLYERGLDSMGVRGATINTRLCVIDLQEVMKMQPSSFLLQPRARDQAHNRSVFLKNCFQKLLHPETDLTILISSSILNTSVMVLSKYQFSN